MQNPSAPTVTTHTSTVFKVPSLDGGPNGNQADHWNGGYSAEIHECKGWCKISVAPGLMLYAFATPNGQVWLQGGSPNHSTYGWVDCNYWHIGMKEDDGRQAEPFISVEITGTPYTRNVYREFTSYTRMKLKLDVQKLEVPDGYTYSSSAPGCSHMETSNKHHHSYAERAKNLTHYLLVPLRVTLTQTGETIDTVIKFHQPRSGTIDLTEAPEAASSNNVLVVRSNIHGYELASTYSVTNLVDLIALMDKDNFEIKQGYTALWQWFFQVTKTPTNIADADHAGIKSMWSSKKTQPNLDRLATEEPLLNLYLLWLLNRQTDAKTTNNKLVKAFLEHCGEDYVQLKNGLQNTMDRAVELGVYKSSSYGKDIHNRSHCLALPGAAEQEQDRKAKESWQYQQTMTGQAGGLGIDETLHPTLHLLVTSGDIPLSIFHAPSNKQHIINNEFDLWEAALTTEGWKDPIVALATDASRRTTYDKPVTPYLAFILWTLPTYLDRVAPRPKGQKWRCMPKFVESQWELEMAEVTDEGTQKQRSALTPVADNETGVVTVPYISMAVTGRMTTYCYSGKYFVAERGMVDPEGDGVWTSDYVEKLNGRDDYGLLFYTLIGTDRNTGYPSFLIILERLDKRSKKAGINTRVHFHRVRPNRSKNGIPTPTNQLIEECYRYMAGNIRAEEITAQQGDLIFLKVDGPGKAIEEPAPVLSFESHAFVPHSGGDPCMVVRSVAKSPTNRLGYIYSENGFSVIHPEHENIDHLDAGWHEIRRCRSFESNPVAVWSLTID